MAGTATVDEDAGGERGLRVWLRGLPRRPRVVAHRLIWGVSPTLTATLAVLIVAGAVVAPLYAVATGALIGAVAAGRDTIGPLVAIAALYGSQQALTPARDAVAAALTRRVDDDIRSRMMRAMLTPHGVAHLEDPSLQDDLGLARGIAWGMTPGFIVQ